MTQNEIVHGYEIAERDLFLRLGFIALFIAGVGLLVLFAAFLILFQ